MIIYYLFFFQHVESVEMKAAVEVANTNYAQILSVYIKHRVS
jgi:hypothetical protein